MSSTQREKGSCKKESRTSCESSCRLRGIKRSWEKTTAAVVEIIEDEFCEDHEYNSNVDESATEDLIEKVLVEPEGSIFFV